MGHLGTHQLIGDHTDHLAAGGQRSIGDDAHQPDLTAAVHEPDPATGHGLAELQRRLAERRRRPAFDPQYTQTRARWC